MKILIFIPARGGSKGIPGKNLINLNGKPLIQYTLETAHELMENKKYDWIPFVSTDDNKIAEFCTRQGFNLEYSRPKELSGDKSLMIDAVFDALSWLESKNQIVEAVLLLQPTSPMRKTTEVVNAIKQVAGKKTFSIISVTKMREHPYECIEALDDGWSFLAKPNMQPSGRQDYRDNYYFIDGSSYFASIDFLNKHQSFVKENITQYHLLDQPWSIDIDENDDLIVAEELIKMNGG